MIYFRLNLSFVKSFSLRCIVTLLLCIVSCKNNRINGLSHVSVHPIHSSTNIKLPDPGTLKGVHWKTYTIPVFDSNGHLVSATINADPKGLSDDEKIRMCASWGINCIALKLEDGGQMTEEFPNSSHDNKEIWNKLSDKEKNILNNARAEGVTRFIKAAYQWNLVNPDKPIYIILFTRKWFQRNGNKIEGNMQDAAKIFADVINKCKKNGYDAPLIGIHAVENRIDAMDSLLPYCLEFADVINTSTNGWLKNKALFFSGLGLGISFRGYASKNSSRVVGIDQCKGSDTFWKDIQSRCAAFCWVQKYYPKWDNEPTNIKYIDKYAQLDDNYDNALKKMEEEFGHKDLKKFVDKAPGEMYNNVLFWGDASDGLRHMNNNICDALKTIWLNNKYYAGVFDHFFDTDAENNSDDWKKQDNIGYLYNGQLKKNIAYDDWEKFFDGSYISTYGSTKKLKVQ